MGIVAPQTIGVGQSVPTVFGLERRVDSVALSTQGGRRELDKTGFIGAMRSVTRFTLTVTDRLVGVAFDNCLTESLVAGDTKRRPLASQSWSHQHVFAVEYSQSRPRRDEF